MTVVEQRQPAGVVVNFLGLPGHVFGGEIGGLVQAGLSQGKGTRAMAVVNSGRKDYLLRKLLDESCKVLQFMDIEFFEDVEPAVEHLRWRLASGAGQPSTN